MGTIALNYDSIYSAAKNAKKVASNTESYVNGLQKKIIDKIDGLKGYSSTYANDAKSHTQAKITSLNKKKDTYNNYADKLEKFVDDDTTGAKAVDKRVAKMFKKDAETFRDNNNIKINPVTQFFTFLCCEFSSSSDFARKLSEMASDVKNWVSDRWDDIKDWYRYKGGEYIANIGKALLGIGLAVVTILITVATGGIGLVAICAIVGSAIAIVDGIVTIGSNIAALTKESTDPAWAKKFSKTDKASTLLRKIDTGSATWNKILNFAATGLDLTEMVCTAVTIVSGIAELGKKLPAFKNLIGDESKGLLKVLTDKSVLNNKRKPVITFKSLRNGLKTLFTNKSVRTQIATKFKLDMKAHFNLNTLKDTIRYEWKHNIKGTVSELVTSKDARARYAELFKGEFKNNVIKTWKDTVGKITSGDKVKYFEGVKNVVKLTNTGFTKFTQFASTGDVKLVSLDDVQGKMKDMYLSMDSLAKSLSDCSKSFQDIKKNIGSISETMDKMQPTPAY